MRSEKGLLQDSSMLASLCSSWPGSECLLKASSSFPVPAHLKENPQTTTAALTSCIASCLSCSAAHLGILTCFLSSACYTDQLRRSLHHSQPLEHKHNTKTISKKKAEF